ncbi:hypothetical protein MYMA111404_03185 [Mycoplasma marinum]|nr:hypothetical protein [Mycoplasma marinum]
MNKKKIVIIASIIGLVFASIALIMGIVFIVNAKNVIDTQKAEYSVNEKTILWIAKQSQAFFGNSTGIAIAGIAIAFIVLLSIISIWIIAGVKSKIKKTKSNGTMTAVAISSIAAVASVAGLGTITAGTIQFKKSSDMENAISYFENNAESISNNKDDAAKAALIYTLANKEGISTFASASTLQLSLAAILFGDMYANKLDRKTKYESLFKNADMQKDFKSLDSKIKFKNPENNKEIKSEEWFMKSRDQISVGDSKPHAANILLNLDGWSEILNGDYPALHKMIKNLMIKNTPINPIVWAQLPAETKKIMVELKYVDATGNVLSSEMFNFMKELTPASLKFERRVVATLGKLLKLPYDTEQNQLKTRLTVLEWLNTVVNSIDYISKDGEFEVVKNIDSTFVDGQLFKPVITSQDPENVYGGTYHKDGTISIDFKNDKPVGTVGDFVYDIKLNLMKKVLNQLESEKMLNKILERQKTITPITFIEHILESKGLKELTDQYAVFNFGYDDNDFYGSKGEAKHIANTADKIEEFIK